MLEKALKKLKDEKSSFTGDNRAQVVLESVISALETFAKQNEEFAQAIAQSYKTLSEVISAALVGANRSISDIQLYSNVVKQYFETAEIKFSMTILTSEYENEVETNVEPVQHSSSKEELTLSLDELLDF